MFVITNRQVNPNKTGLDAFGSIPNANGPNELRMAEAEKVAGRWKVTILPDEVEPATAKKHGLQAKTDASGKQLPVFASQLVAKLISKRLEDEDRDLVLFVHGYNNDMEAVLNRAQGFERDYDVEVVAFSWPANGGGFFGGTTSYLSDKRDAQASVAALSRVLAKFADLLEQFNKERIQRIEDEATKRFPDDDEKWNQFFTRMAEKGCPFSVNMVLHSMGNYLFKHVVQSSVLRVDRLTFDNVVLVAADVNNEGHAEWVDLIQCRNRIYVTINESDGALMASRMKAGEEQKARLGHYRFNLHAQRAVYVDFTRVANVGDSHAYFEGKPLTNSRVKTFFKKVFAGLRGEDTLGYDEGKRLYSLR